CIIAPSLKVARFQPKCVARSDRNSQFNRNLRLNQLSDSILDNELTFLKEAKYYKKIDSKILLANLITYPNRYIIISFDNNYWNITGYHKTNSRSIPYQAKKLRYNKYIEIIDHVTNYKSRKGLRTRMKAKDKLLKLLSMAPENVDLEIEIEEPIILKNEDGKCINYSDTLQVHRMRKKLIKINEVNKKFEICYEDFNLSVSVVAIFRDNFNLYGRLHSRGVKHFQGYSKEERKQFLINGKPVIELDFKALHPYLLYAAEGIQYKNKVQHPKYKNDPYFAVCNDEALRPFLKIILLCMVNNNNFHKAAGAADKWLNKKEKKNAIEKGRTPLKNILLEKGLIDSNDKYLSGKYIKKFKKAHKPISKYLLSAENTGLKLMNKDAKIALEVCFHFAKKGVPILPVHDSFIIQQDYEAELKEVMLKKYQLKTGTKLTIPIK
uniref:hypothetical protein n=1 Tax=uncultured Draconibacterium sp. TaxID=1573823 RepID=UPI0032171A0F